MHRIAKSVKLIDIESVSGCSVCSLSTGRIISNGENTALYALIGYGDRSDGKKYPTLKIGNTEGEELSLVHSSREISNDGTYGSVLIYRYLNPPVESNIFIDCSKHTASFWHCCIMSMCNVDRINPEYARWFAHKSGNMDVRLRQELNTMPGDMVIGMALCIDNAGSQSTITPDPSYRLLSSGNFGRCGFAITAKVSEETPTYIEYKARSLYDLELSSTGLVIKSSL